MIDDEFTTDAHLAGRAYATRDAELDAAQRRYEARLAAQEAACLAEPSSREVCVRLRRDMPEIPCPCAWGDQ